jgi:hypothetical protein
VPQDLGLLNGQQHPFERAVPRAHTLNPIGARADERRQ